MENSSKLNDIPACNISQVSDEEYVVKGLSNQFDLVTGSQMKEMEVKKIEDEITIKRLEKEYRDRQKGLAYLMKKISEYRNERSNSTDIMKRQAQAQQFFEKTANDLKVYLKEVLLINMDNEEKRFTENRQRIAELTATFQAISTRDNHTNFLKETLQCKANEVNNNISRQIDPRKAEYNKLRVTRTKSSSRIEPLKKELNQQTINSNLKDLIENKGKRIIECEAEGQKLEDQLNQELNAILQDKNKFIEEKINSKKSIQENDKLKFTLESKIADAEKTNTDLKRNVEQLKAEKEMLFNNVTKERENVELLTNSLIKRDADIDSELSKIKDKKENLQQNFTIAEDGMHDEIKQRYDELELKKSSLQNLQNSEKYLSKLNEKISNMKKVFGNLELEMEGKLKKAKDNLKKHEEFLTHYNKKQNSYKCKIKELEQKKIQENKKLESSTLEKKEAVGGKQIEAPLKVNTPKNEVAIKNIQEVPKSYDLLSILSIRTSDSDESEDEYNIKNETPKNSKLENTPLTQIKSSTQTTEKEQSSGNTTANLSSSELFDNLTAPSPSQPVTATSEERDVFKFPQTFSQYKNKRKTPQQKQKN